MTVAAITASVLVGMALFGGPTATDDPTPTPTGSGGITITIPLVPGSNDGGTAGGGGTGSGGHGGGGGGTGGTGGGSTGGGSPTCTPATSTPVPPSSSTSGAPRLTIKPTKVAQGGDVQLTATGFAAREKVQIVSYPGGRIVGDVTVRTDGSLNSFVGIPTKQPPGDTVLQATGWTSCHVVNGALLVVSASHAGGTGGPWLGLLIAACGLLFGSVCVFIAGQLGWLPAVFAFRRIA